MRWVESFWKRLVTLIYRRREQSRLDAEIEFHLEQQIGENLAKGMTPLDARRAAILDFGNPGAVAEQTVSTWSWNRIEVLLLDLRVAARTLAKQPGFSLVTILVIAFGIGAAAASITVVWSVLLKPLPFESPDRLVSIYEQSSDGRLPYNVVAPGVFAEWKRDNHGFSDLALVLNAPQYTLSDNGGAPERLRATHCSWNLFRTLGVQPQIGRSFTADDDQSSANATAILSSAIWRRRFGGDGAIVGKTIYLDAKPYTVIGVMPSWFAYPEQAVQLWLPVYHENSAEDMAALDSHTFSVVGRLKPAVTKQQAVEELSAILRRLHDSRIDNPFIGVAANIRPLVDDMVGDVSAPLYILLGATGCMLLIACLNVANLLMARTAARRRELAIRIALGGGRFRVLREQLLEIFVLFFCGSGVGLGIACMALRWFVQTRGDMARVESIHIDGVVISAILPLVFVCAVCSGAIPLLLSRCDDLASGLQESLRTTAGPRRARVRRLLVAAEVAFTLVLLVAAGLLMKSYVRLRSSDLGCAIDNVLTMRFELPEARYRERTQRAEFFDELLVRVRAVPGVEGAGLVRSVPGQGYGGDGGFAIAEHPPLPLGRSQYAITRWADPSYFSAIKIPLLQGRTFGQGQRLDSADEVMVSAAFASQYFRNEDPIGKHLITLGRRSYRIVGVVDDTRYLLAKPPQPMMYFPIEDGTLNGGTLVVRSSRNVESLARPVEQVIREMDSELAVSDVLTMDQIINRSAIDKSFEATLLANFAWVSLLLTVVGLFGMLAYLVSQRHAEIGIRLAVGAQPWQVMRLVLFDGLRPAFAGVVAGLIASVASARLIRSSLYGTAPLDPGVFAAVIGILAGVAISACLLPAWRASRLEPTAVLRNE